MEKVVNYIEYYYKEKGYNCAETIFRSANDAWKLNLEDHIFKCMGGFGGGMGCGNVCGAISGSLAAMGFLYVEETGHKSPLMMEKSKKLIELVRNEFGDEKCCYLSDKYYDEKEGCLNTIRKICNILDALVVSE